MESRLEEIREQQKASWDRFSSGWKKWDELMMEFLRPVGDALIEAIDPSGTDVILDIAAGTGEPGLTIATMLDGGKVVITDLSGDMLKIAQENAERRGIHNVETVACDVCELPFDDNTFDAISCRFGFMFFPDMLLAAQEMFRVLKPGGRFATSVWNVPEKNYWVTAIMSAIQRNMELPAPPPGSPGMFRCAGDGAMTELFVRAGFGDIVQTEVVGTLNAGTVDHYWTMMTDVAAPIVSALSKADVQLQEKIRSEVFADVQQRYPDGNVVFTASSLVLSGVK